MRTHARRPATAQLSGLREIQVEEIAYMSDDDDRVSVRAEQDKAWSLSEDRKNVRLAIPPVPLAGQAKPLRLFLDFDAEAVDAIIDRLMTLRSQMFEPPREASRRN